MGTPLFSGVWIFDLDTLRWVGTNVPTSPLLEPFAPVGNVFEGYNGYFESTNSANLGHPYPPHTYDGLIYQSPALGWGPKGSLIRNAIAWWNNPYSRVVHRFDLSSPSNPPSRPINQLNIPNSYPATALDEARWWYWALSSNGNGPLIFVSFADWSQQSYPAQYNTYGDQSLIYAKDNSNQEFLIGVWRGGNGGVNYEVRVAPIINGIPQAFTTILPIWAPPADARAGGVWSARLWAVVSYEANWSNQVHKLIPPSGSLTWGTWVWQTQTLTGLNGAIPAKNPNATNGAWSRFIEVPELGIFLWADSVTGPVQAWNIQ
jgi:hypothetical protein